MPARLTVVHRFGRIIFKKRGGRNLNDRGKKGVEKRKAHHDQTKPNHGRYCDDVSNPFHFAINADWRRIATRIRLYVRVLKERVGPRIY